MGRFWNRPEVNCQSYGATFALSIIPLAPHGGDFRCRRHHTYDTQSLLYRVTGTSEADFTSWPRTRTLNNIGNTSEMLSWCLASQTLLARLCLEQGY